jgi:hypothetical protein
MPDTLWNRVLPTKRKSSQIISMATLMFDKDITHFDSIRIHYVPAGEETTIIVTYKYGMVLNTTHPL